ncbi:MAG: cell division protein FtsQ/DivIB [Paracoccaceae bacterium]
MPPVNRSDPAPSRLSYRLDRLMLTPSVRVVLRIGLPVLAVLGAITWWFADEARREQTYGVYAWAKAAVEQRPEFMVTSLEFAGASPTVTEDIREVLALDFPISSFDLDLDQRREAIVGLDAVKEADLHIANRVLTVSVTEREPVVIWRKRGGLELIDAQGVLVGPAKKRTNWPHLPVIAGAGADVAVSEALDLLRTAAPLHKHMRGLERRGERRWDVVLLEGQRILLPEYGAVTQLRRALALDQALDLFDRDVVLVDLRLPRRLTLRLSDGAVVDLETLRQTNAGVPQP